MLKKFTDAENINYNSFRLWLAGTNTIPAIDHKVRKAMQEHGFCVEIAEKLEILNAFHKAYSNALKGNYTPIKINEGLKLHLEAAV